jgi:hypothetical protein
VSGICSGTDTTINLVKHCIGAHCLVHQLRLRETVIDTQNIFAAVQANVQRFIQAYSTGFWLEGTNRNLDFKGSFTGINEAKHLLKPTTIF